MELVRLHMQHGNNWRTILENSTAMRDNGRTTIDVKDKARTKGFKERVHEERKRIEGGKIGGKIPRGDLGPPSPRGNIGLHPPPPGLAESIASQLGHLLPPPGMGLPPPNLEPNLAPPNDLLAAGLIPGMPLVKMEPHDNRMQPRRLPEMPDFSHALMRDPSMPPGPALMALSVLERSMERAGLDAQAFMSQSIARGGLDPSHLISPGGIGGSLLVGPPAHMQQQPMSNVVRVEMGDILNGALGRGPN